MDRCEIMCIGLKLSVLVKSYVYWFEMCIGLKLSVWFEVMSIGLKL